MFFVVPQWQFSLSNRCFIYLTHPPRIPRGTNSQINFALFFINKDFFFFFSLNCRKQEQLDGKRGARRVTWATAWLPNPAVWLMQSSSRQLLAVATGLGHLGRIRDHAKGAPVSKRKRDLGCALALNDMQLLKSSALRAVCLQPDTQHTFPAQLKDCSYCRYKAATRRMGSDLLTP